MPARASDAAEAAFARLQVSDEFADRLRTAHRELTVQLPFVGDDGRMRVVTGSGSSTRTCAGRSRAACGSTPPSISTTCDASPS